MGLRGGHYYYHSHFKNRTTAAQRNPGGPRKFVETGSKPGLSNFTTSGLCHGAVLSLPSLRSCGLNPPYLTGHQGLGLATGLVRLWDPPLCLIHLYSLSRERRSLTHHSTLSPGSEQQGPATWERCLEPSESPSSSGPSPPKGTATAWLQPAPAFQEKNPKNHPLSKRNPKSRFLIQRPRFSQMLASTLKSVETRG